MLSWDVVPFPPSFGSSFRLRGRTERSLVKSERPSASNTQPSPRSHPKCLDVNFINRWIGAQNGVLLPLVVRRNGSHVSSSPPPRPLLLLKESHRGKKRKLSHQKSGDKYFPHQRHQRKETLFGVVRGGSDFGDFYRDQLPFRGCVGVESSVRRNSTPMMHLPSSGVLFSLTQCNTTQAMRRYRPR